MGCRSFLNATKLRGCIINDVNPYEPSKEQSAVCDHQRIDTLREVRRWLDGRCILVAILSLLLGTISWISFSLIGEHPFLMASVAEMLAWFVGIGLLTGCIDPRNPWINWLMVYAGTYLINLPFFPPDPLLPVGLIIDLFYSGFGVFAGTMIPSIVAYYFPLRSLSVRRWAGYTVNRLD